MTTEKPDHNRHVLFTRYLRRIKYEVPPAPGEPGLPFACTPEERKAAELVEAADEAVWFAKHADDEIELEAFEKLNRKVKKNSV